MTPAASRRGHARCDRHFPGHLPGPARCYVGPKQQAGELLWRTSFASPEAPRGARARGRGGGSHCDGVVDLSLLDRGHSIKRGLESAHQAFRRNRGREGAQDARRERGSGAGKGGCAGGTPEGLAGERACRASRWCRSSPRPSSPPPCSRSATSQPCTRSRVRSCRRKEESKRGMSDPRPPDAMNLSSASLPP